MAEEKQMQEQTPAQQMGAKREAQLVSCSWEFEECGDVENGHPPLSKRRIETRVGFLEEYPLLSSPRFRAATSGTEDVVHFTLSHQINDGGEISPARVLQMKMRLILVKAASALKKINTVQDPVIFVVSLTPPKDHPDSRSFGYEMELAGPGKTKLKSVRRMIMEIWVFVVPAAEEALYESQLKKSRRASR